jgi:flagellar biosynthetic protein FliQ
MTGAETLDVARDAIWTIVVVSSPLMVVGLVVGVVVSLFQALTQIQEQTLSFAIKLVAVGLTLFLTARWIGGEIFNYTISLFEAIPHLH